MKSGCTLWRNMVLLGAPTLYRNRVRQVVDFYVSLILVDVVR